MHVCACARKLCGDTRAAAACACAHPFPSTHLHPLCRGSIRAGGRARRAAAATQALAPAQAQRRDPQVTRGRLQILRRLRTQRHHEHEREHRRRQAGVRRHHAHTFVGREFVAFAKYIYTLRIVPV